MLNLLSPERGSAYGARKDTTHPLLPVGGAGSEDLYGITYRCYPL